MSNINGFDVYNLAGTGTNPDKDSGTLVLFKVFYLAPGVSVAMIAEYPGHRDSELIQTVEDIAGSLRFSE